MSNALCGLALMLLFPAPQQWQGSHVICADHGLCGLSNCVLLHRLPRLERSLHGAHHQSTGNTAVCARGAQSGKVSLVSV